MAVTNRNVERVPLEFPYSLPLLMRLWIPAECSASLGCSRNRSSLYLFTERFIMNTLCRDGGQPVLASFQILSAAQLFGLECVIQHELCVAFSSSLGIRE